MKMLTIRQKLIAYLTDADDSKINALYILLERDIMESNIPESGMPKEDVFDDTDEQFLLLEQQRESYISGQAQPRTSQEDDESDKG